MNTTVECNEILQVFCTPSSLIAVVVTPDMRQLYFATLRATHTWPSSRRHRAAPCSVCR